MKSTWCHLRMVTLLTLFLLCWFLEFSKRSDGLENWDLGSSNPSKNEGTQQRRGKIAVLSWHQVTFQILHKNYNLSNVFWKTKLKLWGRLNFRIVSNSFYFFYTV